MRFRPLRSASASDVGRVAVAPPPDVMNAVVFDAPGDADTLRTARMPVPSPVISELLVRVVAAGVNPIDAKTRAGAGVSAQIPSFPSTVGLMHEWFLRLVPYRCRFRRR